MSRARDRADGVLHNRTHEDTEGGRESLITFKGEQSGGEISTLAQIQASHDGTADDEKADLIFKTNDGSDGASPTEAARIDSSRNFIVGKTVTTLNTEGHVLAPTFARFTRDSAASVQFNRTTNDGEIAAFYKDATQVGGIGVTGGDLTIGTGDTRVRFIDSLDCVLPVGDAAGTSRDAGIDLGHSETRFKDIYTSGGIYLGAASNSTPVAANHLDDYEYGTWNVSLSGVTVSGGTTEATYVKVGRQVTAIASFTNVTISGGNTVTVTGLPFTAAIRSTTSVPALYYHGNGAEPVYLLLEKNTANMFFQYNRNNNSWASATVTSGSNRYIHFSITYTV